MPTTSLTLLDRLKKPGQADAWDRFVRLYTPLLLHWAQLQNVHGADAEDLAQVALVKLIRLLPGYQRRDGQTFRGWLFLVCHNECRDFRTRRATHPMPSAEALVTRCQWLTEHTDVIAGAVGVPLGHRCLTVMNSHDSG